MFSDCAITAGAEFLITEDSHFAPLRDAGYKPNIDVASSRAGSVPGTHTVGFDGPFETITMTHTNRDRAAFAQGALQAATWVRGKRGWFTIRDVLGMN